MSWGSRPNREVISWFDIFGQTLFGLEDSVQDLVEVPPLKAGIENMLLGFCITLQSMLIKGLLEFCLCYRSARTPVLGDGSSLRAVGNTVSFSNATINSLYTFD